MGKQGKRARRLIRMMKSTFEMDRPSAELIAALEVGLRPGCVSQDVKGWVISRDRRTQDLFIAAAIYCPDQDETLYPMWMMPGIDLEAHDRCREMVVGNPGPFPPNSRGVFLTIGEAAAMVSVWPDRCTLQSSGGATIDMGPYPEMVIPLEVT